MLAKPSCILFSVLILTWLSGSDAACTFPPSWTVVTDTNTCCTGTSCANTDCLVSQIGCADGYTLKTGATTTATCDTNSAWSATPTDICLKKCDVPTGWTVATDTNACCTGTSCTADCVVSEIGCDTGYTLKSGATTTATCNAAGDGAWGAAVTTICLKKCDVPTGWTVATDLHACCIGTSCTADCVVSEIGCDTGYTLKSGATTTATCNAAGDGAWGAAVTTICLKKCDVPTGWTVATDTNACCIGTSCTADCLVSEIGCDTGYTLKSGATTTATCNAAGDGAWGAAVTTICLKKCDVPTGATATTATSSCCAATDTSCPAGCVVTVFDCTTGYTKKSDVVATATCNAAGDGVWSAPAISDLCVQDTTTTTAAASGADDLSITKSIILFVSSVMMLIF